MINVEIVNIKIQILQSGIRFTPIDLFTSLADISKYKTKWIEVYPIAIDNQVYDIADCKNIEPSEILLVNSKGCSTLVKIRYCSKSLVEIRKENGKLCIYLNDKKTDCQVKLIPKLQLMFESVPNSIATISRKTFIKDYLSVVGLDRISVLFFDGCQNWTSNNPCKFCDFHPKRRQDTNIVPSINDLWKYDMDVSKWWSQSSKYFLPGLKYSLKKVLESLAVSPHKHLFFMCGNLLEAEKLWDVIIRDSLLYLAKDINFNNYEVILNVPPHYNVQYLYFLKKIGITTVQYNIEVMNKQLFSDLCPQKLEFEQFIRKMIEAVDILGKGNVRCNLVFGLQNLDDSVRGCEQLASLGIVPDYSIFQPKRHTAMEGYPAPCVSDIMKFSHKLIEIYHQYDYRPIFCNYSSRSSIMNELYKNYEL